MISLKNSVIYCRWLNEVFLSCVSTHADVKQCTLVSMSTRQGMRRAAAGKKNVSDVKYGKLGCHQLDFTLFSFFSCSFTLSGAPGAPAVLRPCMQKPCPAHANRGQGAKMSRYPWPSPLAADPSLK